jgi:hypothetical protein
MKICKETERFGVYVVETDPLKGQVGHLKLVHKVLRRPLEDENGIKHIRYGKKFNKVYNCEDLQKQFIILDECKPF